MDNSLQFAIVFDAFANALQADRWDSPTWESSAHIAIHAATPANPAKKHAAEQQETRSTA
jgi:hypothetical protein